MMRTDPFTSGYAQVLEEITASSGVTNLSRLDPYSLMISQRDPEVSTNYYGYDGHGSVRFLLDLAGGITDTYMYDAFGTLVNSTGSSTPNNYLYAGEQYDSDLGFYYLRARYLNPATGRFWTMDTFQGDNEDPSSLHKYLYCQDNPVNRMDPSGRDSIGSLLMSFSILDVLFAQIPTQTPAVTTLALPWKTVTVDTKILKFSDFDQAKVQAYMTRANQIYSQAKIKLELGSSETWDYDKTQKRTGGEFTADYWQRPSKTVLLPGENIPDITAGQNEGHVSAYFF